MATTEPPPLRSLLHQVRNGMRVIEDRSRCQLALHALELRPSSVYREFRPGRVGRVEREEKDGLCDFLRRCEALHRIGFGHLRYGPRGQVLIEPHFSDDRRFGGAGSYRVDANCNATLFVRIRN